MNKINLRQLVKKAQLLDNDGNYREADKVFNLVKLSQQQLGEFPLTPEQYQKVIPQFNETYLDLSGNNTDYVIDNASLLTLLYPLNRRREPRR